VKKISGFTIESWRIRKKSSCFSNDAGRKFPRFSGRLEESFVSVTKESSGLIKGRTIPMEPDPKDLSTASTGLPHDVGEDCDGHRAEAAA
jgi:hypothetical protein